MQSTSHFERLGGTEGLTKIISDFVDRVTSDLMIGFFFRQIDHKRLFELELQFAQTHLGGPSHYEGRPLKAAHGPHRIMGGQFNRRLVLLRMTLVDHGVSDDIIQAWLAHNESLRSHITYDKTSECNGTMPPLPEDRASEDKA